MADDPPPVELIPLEDEEARETDTDGADDGVQAHSWLRTIAAVVAAGSLLWVGSSVAGMRAADDRQVCLADIQSGVYNPGGFVDDDELGSALIERAEECDLPMQAEALRQTYDR